MERNMHIHCNITCGSEELVAKQPLIKRKDRKNVVDIFHGYAQ